MDILGVIAMALATVVAWWSAHRKDLCMTVLFCFLLLVDCILMGR